MKFGPIQLFLIEFDNSDNFTGEILRELESVRGRDIVRVIDGLLVAKDTAGNIFEIEKSDLTYDETVEFGNLIGRLMGLSSDGSVDDAKEALSIAEETFGFDQKSLNNLKDRIKPGTSSLILLIEHIWAINLSAALRNAGGHLVAQGMLSRDALMVIGKELDAVVEAEAVLELADAVKGAAVLDAIATVAEARYIEAAAEAEAENAVRIAMAVKAAAAADAVRALVIAGLIEDAAVAEAIEVLREAELIEETAVREAVKTAELSREEIDAVKAEVDAAAG